MSLQPKRLSDRLANLSDKRLARKL